MLQIYIGSLDNPSYYFEDEDIFEAPSTQSLSLIWQKLSVDTFSPIVADRKGDGNVTKVMYSNNVSATLGLVFDEEYDLYNEITFPLIEQ